MTVSHVLNVKSQENIGGNATDVIALRQQKVGGFRSFHGHIMHINVRCEKQACTSTTRGN